MQPSQHPTSTRTPTLPSSSTTHSARPSSTTATTSRPSSQTTSSHRSPHPDNQPNPAFTVSQPTAAETHYTAFIRLPFPRGSFVDPPQVEWDAAKDRALWNVLSSARSSSSDSGAGAEIDWKALAARFDVPLPFALQRAAWLYERQLSQVRAQMRKVHGGSKTGNSPTPGPAQGSRKGSADVDGLGLGLGLGLRKASTEGGVRVSLGAGTTLAEDTPRGGLSVEGSKVDTPKVTPKGTPALSRTTSSNTVTQSKAMGSSPGRPRASSLRATQLAESTESERNDETTAAEEIQQNPRSSSPSESDKSSSSSSSSSDEDQTHQIRRSQVFRRGGLRFATTKPISQQRQRKTDDLNDDEDHDGTYDDEDDDDDTPAFLPLSRTTTSTSADTKSQSQDLGATIRTPQQQQQGERRMVPERIASDPAHRAQLTTIDSSTTTTNSSASSAAPLGEASPSDAGQTSLRDVGTGQTPAVAGNTPLSPKRKAELAAGRSPRPRKADGSDGTPSMGSSFSDLEDTSITQSALEEALLSNMRHGGNNGNSGAASRVSSIGQALKPRYL